MKKFFMIAACFLFLFKGERIGLAVRAQREDAVDAALQQALDLLAQLLVVDGLLGVVVHRGDYRGDDAFNVRNFHRKTLLL